MPQVVSLHSRTGNFRAKHRANQVLATKQGGTWSTYQWQTHHLHQSKLLEHIAYLEECLRELG